MKPSLPILSFIAAGALVLATVPRAHAQLDDALIHTPDHTLVHTPAGPQPTASPAEEPDMFDALKKGITKVQKQTKEAKQIEPQIKALQKQQDAMQQELTEGKERLHTVLVHQSEEIKTLQATVERLETQLKALKPAASTPATPPGPIGVPTQP